MSSGYLLLRDPEHAHRAVFVWEALGEINSSCLPRTSG